MVIFWISEIMSGERSMKTKKPGALPSPPPSTISPNRKPWITSISENGINPGGDKTGLTVGVSLFVTNCVIALISLLSH